MIDKIYVMSRPDGWHKIGISSDPMLRRKSVGHRAVVVVHTRDLGNLKAYIVEKSAHMEMGEVERSGEWFNSSSDNCVAAINRALTRYNECGPDEWKRTVEAKWRASGRRGINNGKAGRSGITLTAEQRREWGRMWKSKDFETNKDALAAMGDPFNAVTANKLFGPSGRPVGPRKRNET